MSLNSGKTQLLGDRKSTSSIYRLISIIHTLAAFQLVVMNIGNNRGGFCNVAPDTGNDRVGA